MSNVVSYLPYPKFKSLNGTLATANAAGYVYTFQAGTTTPLATYSESTGTTANSNPIVLDGNGECNLWTLNSNNYKLVITDGNPNVVSGGIVGNILDTIDNVYGGGSNVLSLTSNLQINDFAITDQNARKYIQFGHVNSAVNYFTVTNGTTGNGPILGSQSSSDSNVDMNYATLGTGLHKFNAGVTVASGNLVITSGGITMTSGNITFTSGQLQTLQGANVASATTPVLANGNYFIITGGTTITGFGSQPAGTTVNVKFTGTPQLTHNSTSFILQNAGNNITAGIGDTASFIALSSGYWQMTGYARANGTALVSGSVTLGTIVDSSGNNILQGSATASAVNWLEISNSATTFAPLIGVTGSDTNIGIGYVTKGSGIHTFTNPVTISSGNFIISSGNATLTSGNLVVTSGTLSVSSTITSGAITASGTSVINQANILDTNGNKSIAIDATASAVNWLRVINSATGNNVTITTAGADTTPGIIIQPKNSGPVAITCSTFTVNAGSGILFGSSALTCGTISSTAITASGTSQINQAYIYDTAGVINLQIVQVGSAVNYLTSTSSATNNPLVIGAAGSDTNISIRYNTKGTGSHVFNNAIQFNSNNGILDSNSNEMLKLSPVSTAVNYFTIANAATSGSPTISTTGSDTNIILTLKGKGSGGVTLNGTTAADSAAAGYVGEFVTSNIAAASATSLTTATAKNVTSISLTAGDWDVFGNVNITGSSTNLSVGLGWTSITSATAPDLSLSSEISITAVLNVISMSVPYLRVNVSSTTPVYLTAYAAFSTGTASACGTISARRVR